MSFDPYCFPNGLLLLLLYTNNCDDVLAPILGDIIPNPPNLFELYSFLIVF